MMRRTMVLLLCLPLIWGTTAEYLSAERKFKMIEGERLRHGTRVTLTKGELNAYARQEVAQAFPSGVRQPRLELANGVAIGSALIDFGKVRRAQGKPPGWLMSKILDGEREVEVTANIRSGGGRATVDVQSVKISGIAIEGRVLDFLIHNYLLASYPEAKVGQPFELNHGIDRLDVKPSAVDVVIR
jgi:hypothetical protein